MIEEKTKNDSPLIYDPSCFWHTHPFWNFDHSPVNYDIETSKKRAVSIIPTQNPHYWTVVNQILESKWIVARLKKSKHEFVKNVSPAFNWIVAMCQEGLTLLI